MKNSNWGVTYGLRWKIPDLGAVIRRGRNVPRHIHGRIRQPRGDGCARSHSADRLRGLILLRTHSPAVADTAGQDRVPGAVRAPPGRDIARVGQSAALLWRL